MGVPGISAIITAWRTDQKALYQCAAEIKLEKCGSYAYAGAGVPLLWSGDEMGNSQNGNNNAYCQDNPTGWVNWKNEKSHRRQIEFLQQVIAFRKEHTVLSNPMPFQFSDYKSLGYPDLSYHGTSAWMLEPTPDHLCLGMLYCGAYAQNEKEPDVYVAYNFLAAATELALPKPRKGKNGLSVLTAEKRMLRFWTHQSP